MIDSIENPKATMRYHPIIRLLQRDSLQGGLDMFCDELNFCAFSSSVRSLLPKKETNIFHNSPWLHEMLTDGQGVAKWKCPNCVEHLPVRGACSW